LKRNILIDQTEAVQKKALNYFNREERNRETEENDTELAIEDKTRK